jgi:lipopolysaccharide transport system permease protein
MYEIRIEAGKTEQNYWRDLWSYRELLYFLAWRDILVRYKQTAIGVAWSVLRPLLTMLVFTPVFGRLAKLPSDSVPYPILVFAAMLPWQFFSNAISETASSVITNANMLTKIYFPRLIIPASAIAVAVVDFLISLIILVIIMLWYHFVPDWKIIFLPAFFLLALGTSLGGGLWLAALTVKYRDFRYVVPFIVQLGLYISPVGFSSAVVPEQWRLLYSLNPMVGVIDGFRWSLTGAGSTLYLPGLILSIMFTLILIGTGVWYFRRTERSFADII